MINKKEPSKKVMHFKIHLLSEGNISDHWTKKRNRRLFQQNYIAQKWYTEGIDLKPPVSVTLTRLAPRTLDDDNLVTAFKGIRDRVASLLVPGLKPGRADNHKGIEWKYSQEKNKQYLVKITLETVEKEKTA